MILAVDIGNTSIALGLLKGDHVYAVHHVETLSERDIVLRKLRRVLRQIRKQYSSIEDILMSSVVPNVAQWVFSELKKGFGLRPVIAHRDIPIPLVNRYKNPKQVGVDRLLGAFATARLYGTPAIVVDLGTAITFDVVSKKEEYMGGIIVPGIRLSAESLYRKTALLPRIEIQKPPALIGRDTEGSMLSGLFYGYGAMISGLVGELSRKISGRPKVILTGGYAELMRKYIGYRVDVIDPYLVLRGMSLLWVERSAQD